MIQTVQNITASNNNICYLKIGMSYAFCVFLAARLPEFVTSLQDVKAVQGRAAKFEVVIEGQPKPEVTWFKGTRPIYESEKFEISREGDRCVLVVRDVYGEDEDEYSCRATNKAGSRMSRADLRIKCKYTSTFSCSACALLK